MRKVKVATALACVIASGLFGGTTLSGNAPVSVADAGHEVLLEILTEPVATAASIETTAIVTTAATTSKTTTTIEETTTLAESSTEETTTTEIETTTETTTETEMTTETAESSTEILTAASAEVFTTSAVTETSVSTEASADTTTSAVTTYAETETQTTTTETVVSTEETTSPAASPALTVTEREYIMLCNVVGHEYGSYWVSEYDKALVVEVIMNRVNSPLFPNTIYEVLTQRNQFAGLSYYINLGTFSSQVTDSVKAAVDLYLSDPSQFNHGYLYFTGDGYRNYFR